MTILDRLNRAARAFLAPDTPRPASARNYDPAGGFFSTDWLLTGQQAGLVNGELPYNDFGLALAHEASIWMRRCVTVRAAAVGAMPWQIETANGTVLATSRDRDIKHPAAQAIKAVPYRQHAGLFELWETALCVTGENFIEKIRNPFGYTTGLRWLNPLAVQIVAPSGVIEGFHYSGAANRVTFTPDELLFDKLPNLRDDVRGLPPASAALSAVNTQLNIEAFVRAFFRNNARLGLIFSPKEGMFNDDDFDAMVSAVAKHMMGVSNAYRPQVFNKPTNVDAVEPPKLEDQMAAKDRTAQEILVAFGVPRPIAGDTDSTQYQAHDDVQYWFYSTTVIPSCTGIADAFNIGIMPAFDRRENAVFKFDTSAFDRVSQTERDRLSYLKERFESGAIDLYTYQVETGNPAPDETFKGLYRVAGINGYVPAAELPTIYQASLPSATYDPYAQMRPSAPTEPVTVSAPAAPQLTETVSTPALKIVEPPARHAPPPIAEDPAPARAALAELRAWRKFLANNTIALRSFEPRAIDAATALCIASDLRAAQRTRERRATFAAWERALLARMGETDFDQHEPDELPLTATRGYLAALTALRSAASDHDHLFMAEDLTAAARQHYARVLSARALADVRSRFEAAALALFKRAQAERMPKQRFRENFEVMLFRYARFAMVEGYADGGIEAHELTDDDDAWLLRFNGEQRTYIDSVADALYADDALTDDEIEGKPRMWWNLSVNPAYNEGLVRASGDGLGEFNWGATSDSCPDCTALNGRRYRMSEWLEHFGGELVPCNKTACGGFNCKCRIRPALGRRTPGAIPALVGPSRSAYTGGVTLDIYQGVSA